MPDKSVFDLLRSDEPLIVIEAPAGCGKTYQGTEFAHDIAPTLGNGRMLILTHTNAACDVFGERTRGVSRNAVEIRTINALICQIASVYHKVLDLPPDPTVWAFTHNGFAKLAARVAAFLQRNPVVPAALARRYYAEAALTDDFEARATLVVGPSRIGKTSEMDHQRRMFNQAEIEMLGGRPAKMVKVVLRGSSSWKELGVLTLRALGYNIEIGGAVNQTLIWNMVIFHAKANGVVCIHYDECQHIFVRRSAEVQEQIRDCFKSLLKQPEWPLMLVFSGIDDLKRHILAEEQLGNLVKTVTFAEIDPKETSDLSEMNSICFAYAEKVGLDFSALSSADFHRRLAFACSNRWGLVIELVILAAVIAKKAKST